MNELPNKMNSMCNVLQVFTAPYEIITALLLFIHNNETDDEKYILLFL